MHPDVYVYNGSDVPVVARLGHAELVVPPRRHDAFGDVLLDTATFSASWEGDSEPFESFRVDLSGRRSETVVHNVAAKGVLWVDYVLYGDTTPQAGRMLQRGPVILVGEGIDYPFTAPADAKYVAEGSFIENSVLGALDVELEVTSWPYPFLPLYQHPLNLEAARLQLEAHPENAELAMVTAGHLLSQDPEAAINLMPSCLERASDEVDLHR